MNWTPAIIIIAVLLVLLAICYYRIWKTKRRDHKDKQCQNCKKKEYDSWFEIWCRNKKSKHYGTMMDDYAVCEHWRGIEVINYDRQRT